MSMNVWLPILVIVVCILLKMPIFYSLMTGSLTYFLLMHGLPHQIMVQRLLAITETSSQLAIPFFITAGCIMNYCGISKRLLDFAEGLVGHLTGGLAHVNVLVSVMMGGISGSAAADAASDCKLLVPEMIRRGYDKDFSASITIASSMITPIIPPGIGLIIYATTVGVSTGRIFAAGYVPGFLMAVAFMIYCAYVSKKRGYKPTRQKMASLSEMKDLFVAAFSALLIPFGIILALRFGVFTATEAGAVLAWYAIFVGAFIYKELKWEHVWPILKEATISTAVVMLMICAANSLTYFFTYERIPNLLTSWLLSMNLNKYTFMLLVNVLLLIVGMFMDGSAPLIILAPLLAPVAVSLGIDPIHFGIVFCVNVALGNMTPPFGIVLYQVGGLLDVDLVTLSKGVFPFILLMLAILLLISYVPWLVLAVPNLIYG